MFNGQKQKLTIIFLSLSRMSSHILRGLGIGRDAFGYKTKGGGVKSLNVSMVGG